MCQWILFGCQWNLYHITRGMLTNCRHSRMLLMYHWLRASGRNLLQRVPQLFLVQSINQTMPSMHQQLLLDERILLPTSIELPFNRLSKTMHFLRCRIHSSSWYLLQKYCKLFGLQWEQLYSMQFRFLC